MMDWSGRGNIRKRGPLWELFRKRTQLFAADRRTSRGLKKKKPPGARQKHQKKQEKANAVPQADGGLGARGTHRGESCNGTDVDTGG